MRFYTNRIPTGTGRSFAQLVEDFRGNKEPQVKIASADEAVKTAEEKDEADSSGQLDVEPLHQVGESTPSPGKKDESKSEAKADTEVKDAVETEAKESETQETEVKEAEAEVAEASDDCDCGEGCECKGGDDDCPNTCGSKACMASTDEQVKEASEKCDTDNENKGDAESSGQTEWEGKKENNNDPNSDDTKEAAAAESAQFVKLSNLDGKSKKWLSDYWNSLYPPEFVEAMLADK